MLTLLASSCPWAWTPSRSRRPSAPRCPLVLRSPPRQVRKALEISGLAALCPIQEAGQPGPAGPEAE